MDCFQAQIEIGGDFSPAQQDRLVEWLVASTVGVDWGGPCSADRIRDVLAAADRARVPATFTDDSARYGMFEALESWLREQGLDYRRQSSAKYEYDGEIQTHVGGRTRTVLCTDDGQPLVPLEDLRNVLGRPDSQLQDALRELIARHSPEDPAPFRLVTTGG